MTNTLFATKLGMTEAYVGETRRGVTVLKVMPMQVVGTKSQEKDGYDASQVIFGEAPKKTNKAVAGHLKKSGLSGRFLRELKLDSDHSVGDSVDTTAITQPGSIVDATAVSKGKGLAGVVKRWHFAGGPRTHGQSDRLRRAGSIGQGTTPGRVYKGKHMSGRMGNVQVTVKNLQVVSFDPTSNSLMVAGAIPGHNGALVKIRLVKQAAANFPSVTLTKSHQVVAPVEAVQESEAQ